MKMKWRVTCSPCPIACKYLTMMKIIRPPPLQSRRPRQPQWPLETVSDLLDCSQPCKTTSYCRRSECVRPRSSSSSIQLCKVENDDDYQKNQKKNKNKDPEHF